MATQFEQSQSAAKPSVAPLFGTLTQVSAAGILLMATQYGLNVGVNAGVNGDYAQRGFGQAAHSQPESAQLTPSNHGRTQARNQRMVVADPFNTPGWMETHSHLQAKRVAANTAKLGALIGKLSNGSKAKPPRFTFSHLEIKQADAKRNASGNKHHLAINHVYSAGENQQHSSIALPKVKLDQAVESTDVLTSASLDLWQHRSEFSLGIASSPNDSANISSAKKKTNPVKKDKFVIMLDPGHGGTDQGSVAHNGLMEKALTLDIAKRASRMLSEIENIEVVLSRDKDIGLSRANRVDRVRRSNADVVVSLHLNHLPQQEINLVETFYAAPHNIRESIEKQRTEKNKAGLVKTNAARKMNFDFTKGSAALAQVIQKRVFNEVAHNNPNTDNAGVKQDTLYVLTRSFTPGVLIELSCLSNITEAKRLTDPKYRDRLAAALVDGIREYLATPAASGIFDQGV